MRRRLILCLFVAAGGCGGVPARPGVFARTESAGEGWRPRAIAVAFPQVASGALTARGAVTSGRAWNGAEITALVHAEVLAALRVHGTVRWKDLAAAGTASPRVARLSTALLEQVWLAGAPQPGAVHELCLRAGTDGVLLVSVLRFGESTVAFKVTGSSGQVAEDSSAGPGPFRTFAVLMTLLKADGAVGWQGASGECGPASRTQEATAESAVTRLAAALPVP